MVATAPTPTPAPTPVVQVVGCALRRHDGSMAGSVAQGVASQSPQAAGWSWLIGQAATVADSYSEIVVVVEDVGDLRIPSVRVRVRYGDGGVQWLSGAGLEPGAHETLSARAAGGSGQTCAIDPVATPMSAPAGGH